jgi:DNA replication protein DnaC
MSTLIQERVIETLRKLKLDTAAEALPALLADATRRALPLVELMDLVMGQELAARSERGLIARMKLAHFPTLKSLDTFDVEEQPSLDRRLFNDLATMGFLGRQEGVALLGPPGVGKTHLAIGLGVKAVELGYRAYFLSAQDLLHAIQSARMDGIPGHKQRHLTAVPLLIIDELGYVEFDRPSATWLFQLLCQRYERHSTIITSNKAFSQWGEIFGEDAMASALLDRYLHHCHVVTLSGQSYRMKQRQQGSATAAPKRDGQVGSP